MSRTRLVFAATLVPCLVAVFIAPGMADDSTWSRIWFGVGALALAVHQWVWRREWETFYSKSRRSEWGVRTRLGIVSRVIGASVFTVFGLIALVSVVA